MNFENIISYMPVMVMFIFIGITISTGYEIYKDSNIPIEEKPMGNTCMEICSTNNELYYKIVSSGFAGLTYTCYCKTMEGAIKTYPM